MAIETFTVESEFESPAEYREMVKSVKRNGERMRSAWSANIGAGAGCPLLTETTLVGKLVIFIQKRFSK